LEVSRLARNNRDWYQLLDLCGLMNTLIVDADGVYDPRQLNDRLLLGLKGTLSEAELGWIRQRAWEGALTKARRGELVIGLPVGYVRTRDPEATEMALRDRLPRRYWIGYNDLLVAFGQNICTPVSPRCSTCPVNALCRKVGVTSVR